MDSATRSQMFGIEERQPVAPFTTHLAGERDNSQRLISHLGLGGRAKLADGTVGMLAQ